MADDAAAGLRPEIQVIALWPQPPFEPAADVPPESIFQAPGGGGPETSMLRNVCVPSLSVFLPDPAKANGVGVIIAPGGGWRILAWQHEGLDLADWLTARGYAAFVLKYRLKATPADPAKFASLLAQMSARSWDGISGAKAPRSMTQLGDEPIRAAREMAADDGRRSLEIVRERGDEWGVRPDRIGMVGFSAGAFLAADVAMAPGGPPLAFVAPIYGGETRGAPVPPDAPPLFTVIAADDRMLFKVVEGLYADWSNADRPAELHIFARGGHGFGMARQQRPVDRWIDLFADWLADQGF
ncbi:MAG TPA: dienelactone hydrolase family protein [Caulobacteraceae bacterium]